MSQPPYSRYRYEQEQIKKRKLIDEPKLQEMISIVNEYLQAAPSLPCFIPSITLKEFSQAYYEEMRRLYQIAGWTVELTRLQDVQYLMFS